MPILNSHKPATFNGGTITSPITIDTAATTDTGLTISGSRTSTENALNVTYPHSQFSVGTDGFLAFISDDAPIFQISAQGGTDATLKVRGATSDVFIDSATGGVNTNGNGPIALADGLKIQNHSAPSDGSLAAGDCVLWFDQTNGAAKLMVKAKQADGAVKTAAIALS